MSRTKIIVAKVFIGIICAVLILGTVFMTTIILIFKHGNVTPEDLESQYTDLQNICGDDCVYVAENFFVDNNLKIPEFVYYPGAKRGNTMSVNVKGETYQGRSREIGYYFVTGGIDEDVVGSPTIRISCDPKDIEKLQNKKKHNGYSYGFEYNEFISALDSELMVNEYFYTINFNRNANTSKKCQLSMEIRIEHDKNITSDEYNQLADNLFYSLLDNIVYRTI